MTDDQDAEYAAGRVPGRFYLSKRFPYASPTGDQESGDAVADQVDGSRVGQATHFAYEVMQGDDQIAFSRENGVEVVLRETPKQRRQLKALFFEDDRHIERIVFQRFAADGRPLGPTNVFTLTGQEISHLKNFLGLVETVPIPDSAGVRLDPSLVGQFLKSPQARSRVGV
jgi:hypothetical protein